MRDLIDKVIVIILLIGISSVFLFVLDSRGNKRLESTPIQPSIPPTDKTILSGTTPHEFGGETSRRLRQFAGLPDTGWFTTEVPYDLLQKALDSAGDMNVFSVLYTIRSAGPATPDKVGGIEFSLRADFVRPAQMHVSQSSWNPDRNLYEMDEWITLGNATYVNMGLWSKSQHQQTNDRLADMNSGLLPEAGLSDFLELKIEHYGILNFEGTPYYFIESAMQEAEGARFRTQVWIEQNSRLIRKIRIAYYENKFLMGEIIYAFVRQTSARSIFAPDWINTDSNDVIINTTVCVVEHW